ncbi:MAG: hypothetical protein PHC80_01125 [Eubacteriales bacterium]|nr:hypothetical protein [Eubacteriales bacterium]
MDEKKLNPVSEETLGEVAGGTTNFDYFGNPIGPLASNTIVPNAIAPGLSCLIKNENGAAYACPNCGSTNFRIRSADAQQINLQCRNCKTKFTVANL